MEIQTGWKMASPLLKELGLMLAKVLGLALETSSAMEKKDII